MNLANDFLSLFSHPSPLREGCFVSTKTDNLGFGKVLKINLDYVSVEFFYSVAKKELRELPLNEVHRVKLPHQSRCYVKDRNSDLYRIGRILQWFDGEYEVHFPDQDAGFYSEEDIFTRCNQPLEDPLEVLIQKGHDTPFFHDKRRSLFDMFINQRGFAHGMTGLISSKIELYPHQVEVIRRVLEDPIQRYLLADEVGLGKTIEAGVILRQYLLDYGY